VTPAGGIDPDKEDSMPPLVIPILETWGTKQHLRYAVSDTTGRYWTGSGWATRQQDVLLYASHHDAAADAHRILLRQFRRSPVYQQFVVPLELQVFAQAEISPEDLKHFAKKCIKLSALFADHGTGPRPDSLVLPRLNWRKLTQPINSERDLDIDE
jgi:hypothetical protein